MHGIYTVTLTIKAFLGLKIRRRGGRWAGGGESGGRDRRRYFRERRSSKKEKIQSPSSRDLLESGIPVSGAIIFFNRVTNFHSRT